MDDSAKLYLQQEIDRKNALASENAARAQERKDGMAIDQSVTNSVQPGNNSAHSQEAVNTYSGRVGNSGVSSAASNTSTPLPLGKPLSGVPSAGMVSAAFNPYKEQEKVPYGAFYDVFNTYLSQDPGLWEDTKKLIDNQQQQRDAYSRGEVAKPMMTRNLESNFNKVINDSRTRRDEEIRQSQLNNTPVDGVAGRGPEIPENGLDDVRQMYEYGMPKEDLVESLKKDGFSAYQAQQIVDKSTTGKESRDLYKRNKWGSSEEGGQSNADTEEGIRQSYLDAGDVFTDILPFTGLFKSAFPDETASYVEGFREESRGLHSEKKAEEQANKREVGKEPKSTSNVIKDAITSAPSKYYNYLDKKYGDYSEEKAEMDAEKPTHVEGFDPNMLRTDGKELGEGAIKEAFDPSMLRTDGKAIGEGALLNNKKVNNTPTVKQEQGAALKGKADKELANVESPGAEDHLVNYVPNTTGEEIKKPFMGTQRNNLGMDEYADVDPIDTPNVAEAQETAKLNTMQKEIQQGNTKTTAATNVEDTDVDWREVGDFVKGLASFALGFTLSGGNIFMAFAFANEQYGKSKSQTRRHNQRQEMIDAGYLPPSVDTWIETADDDDLIFSAANRKITAQADDAENQATISGVEAGILSNLSEDDLKKLSVYHMDEAEQKNLQTQLKTRTNELDNWAKERDQDVRSLMTPEQEKQYELDTLEFERELKEEEAAQGWARIDNDRLRIAQAAAAQLAKYKKDSQSKSGMVSVLTGKPIPKDRNTNQIRAAAMGAASMLIADRQYNFRQETALRTGADGVLNAQEYLLANPVGAAYNNTTEDGLYRWLADTTQYLTDDGSDQSVTLAKLYTAEQQWIRSYMRAHGITPNVMNYRAAREQFFYETAGDNMDAIGKMFMRDAEASLLSGLAGGNARHGMPLTPNERTYVDERIIEMSGQIEGYTYEKDAQGDQKTKERSYLLSEHASEKFDLQHGKPYTLRELEIIALKQAAEANDWDISAWNNREEYRKGLAAKGKKRNEKK